MSIIVSPGAQRVLGILDAGRTDGVWFPDCLVDILELFPESALACALATHHVWDVDRRDAFLREVRPIGRPRRPPRASAGGRLESFFIDVQDAAYKRKAALIDETDIAAAFVTLHAGELVQLGIDTSCLVEETTYHCNAMADMERRFARQLDQRVRASTTPAGLRRLLGPHKEEQGTVEWKRALDIDATSAEEAFIALVNANPLRPVHLVFGVEDSGSVVGQVSRDGTPMPDDNALRCRERLTQRFFATDPPLTVRWNLLDHEGMSVWVLSGLGRLPGSIVRTGSGRFPMRSGGHTRYLHAYEIAALLGEPRRFLDAVRRFRPAK